MISALGPYQPLHLGLGLILSTRAEISDGIKITVIICIYFRCRLRKKTWKNPGTIYMDDQVYEDEIPIYPNWEVFLEALDGMLTLYSIGYF